jgi:hypothetical protein
MTDDYRLAHLGLADRHEWPAISSHTKSLYPDDEDSSLRSE